MHQAQAPEGGHDDASGWPVPPCGTTAHIHTAPTVDHSLVSPHVSQGWCAEAAAKALCSLRTALSTSSRTTPYAPVAE